MKSNRGSLIITLVAALVAVAVAAFAASAGAATSMSKNPPCTKAALSAGLKRGPAAEKKGKVLGSFGCASGWAYSEIVVGKGKNAFDAVAVYKAKNGAWATVNRAKPCRTHAVPKKIYKPACTTS
jgi:hypothetical protein